MEKVIYLLAVDQAAEALLGFVESSILPALTATQAQDIHFALADDTVLPAADKSFQQAGAEFNAYLSFSLPTALQLDSWMAGEAEQAFLTALGQSASNIRAYTVTESTVMDVKDQLASAQQPGITRLPGWQQVVTLQIPESMPRQDWLDTWLYSHSDIACKTQATFGYIHNIVQRPLKDTVRSIDAVVTENFPDEAMTSAEAFYDAVGDPAKQQLHFQQMMQSCERFIDNTAISVVPMRAYALLEK